MAREFPGARFDVRDIEHQRDFKAVKHFGIISKAPCKRCNESWMSRLESKAQPILTPMMHGASVTLTPSDQLLVSRWLIKTAIMYDLHEGGRTSELFFTADECRALQSGLVVPPDTLMFLGIYIGQLASGTHQFFFGPDIEYLPEAYSNMSDMEAYTATFTIKHLALQVFSFRRPKHLKAEPLEISIPADWSEAEIQLWPIANRAISWPPPSFLDDALIEDYQTRFLDLSVLGRA